MSTDLAVIEAALKAATPGPWRGAVGGTSIVQERGEGVHDRLIAMVPNFSPETIANRSLIANAPEWLAELVERVKGAEAVLRDFAEFGTRHDTTPTVAFPEGPASTGGWYGYLQQMDTYVRSTARQALQSAPEAPRAACACRSCRSAEGV